MPDEISPVPVVDQTQYADPPRMADGRPAPSLWVVYECPVHRGRFEINAYDGPPRCKACPGEPWLEPLSLSLGHTEHYRNPKVNYSGRDIYSEM